MQSAQLDPRIVQVGVEVNGRLKIYEGLTIYATGTRYANALQNECEVKITNLDKSTRDYILSETSPYNKNKTPKLLVVKAGRVSYGTATIFSGNIVSSIPSQAPDITITIKALAGNYNKGDIISRSAPGQTTLSKISANIAQDLNLPLIFQAKDKQIANYNFSGAALKQVEQLGQLGSLNAFVDNETLIVKDINNALTGRSRILSLDSGMVGIPQPTEFGIRVSYLLDSSTTLGGSLQLKSVVYPSLNGNYIIYKLSFEIASRDTPFYWIAEAKRA